MFISLLRWSLLRDKTGYKYCFHPERCMFLIPYYCYIIIAFPEPGFVSVSYLSDARLPLAPKNGRINRDKHLSISVPVFIMDVDFNSWNLKFIAINNVHVSFAGRCTGFKSGRGVRMTQRRSSAPCAAVHSRSLQSALCRAARRTGAQANPLLLRRTFHDCTSY